MSKIILIRHAKVLLDNKEKITASQMNAWVEAYNHASIDTTLPTQGMVECIGLWVRSLHIRAGSV